jgi:hypothetical protein
MGRRTQGEVRRCDAVVYPQSVSQSVTATEWCCLVAWLPPTSVCSVLDDKCTFYASPLHAWSLSARSISTLQHLPDV